MLEQADKPLRPRWHILTLLGGVILPAISIAVEATTHICAEQFFDPIPTQWHLLLVIFVPLAHLQVWLAVTRGQTERGALLGLTNAFAIGISIFYTIVYVPILPLALIALAFAGLGLLPLAPLFALIWDGSLWSSFIATRGNERLRVCERIHTDTGESWTDASSWYWAAARESSVGPWWAITIAEGKLEATP